MSTNLVLRLNVMALRVLKLALGHKCVQGTALFDLDCFVQRYQTSQFCYRGRQAKPHPKGAF